MSVLMAIVEARDTIRRALAIAIVALARAERCPYSEPGSQKILAKKMKMLLGTLADDDLSLAMPGMMVVYHLKTLPRAVSSYAQNRCEPLTAGAPMERGTPPGEAGHHRPAPCPGGGGSAWPPLVANRGVTNCDDAYPLKQRDGKLCLGHLSVLDGLSILLICVSTFYLCRVSQFC